MALRAQYDRVATIDLTGDEPVVRYGPHVRYRPYIDLTGDVPMIHYASEIDNCVNDFDLPANCTLTLMGFDSDDSDDTCDTCDIYSEDMCDTWDTHSEEV